MIYLLLGNDSKNKNIYVKSITKNSEVVFITSDNFSLDLINRFSSSQSLFGDSPVIILEDILNNKEINITDDVLSTMKESDSVFIFLEDKILLKQENKYSKYAEIEKFEQKIIKSPPKINAFNIADYFAKKDKINTWISYREAIESGMSPEAISGILFWKIKTMILNKNKFFTPDELKLQSSSLLSIYHKAHNGESDLSMSLEQFILSFLSK